MEIKTEKEKKLIFAAIFMVAGLFFFLFNLKDSAEPVNGNRTRFDSAKLDKNNKRSKQQNNRTSNRTSKTNSRNTGSYHSSSYSHSSSSSSYYSGSSHIRTAGSYGVRRKNTISKERLKAIEDFEKQSLEDQRAYMDRKIRAALESDKTPPLIKLRARLVTSESYVEAARAFELKDYKKAIEYYNKVFEDSESTPEMKYIAMSQIELCSRLIGNLKLFVIACREKGKLMATEDLKILKVDKSDDYLKWAIEFADYAEAVSSSSAKNTIVNKMLQKYAMTRTNAEKYVDRKIQSYRVLFKEFKEFKAK